MRISVFGPRELTQKQKDNVKCFWTLFKTKRPNIIFIHGGSKGLQKYILDIEEKEYNNKAVILFKPWNILDKSIPYSIKLMFNRNKQIIENCELVILFELENINKLLWISEYCTKKGIAFMKIT